MKTVKFTDKKNISKSIPMEKSDTLFALRFKKPHPGYSDKKAKKIFQRLGIEVIHHFSDTGSFIVKVTEKKGLKNIKDSLKDEGAFDYIGGAYLLDGEPVVYTGNIVVMFRECESEAYCLTLLDEKDFIIKNKLRGIKNVWLVAHKEIKGSEIFEQSNKLSKHPAVEMCYPEIIQQKSNKIIHHNQWHLMPTVVTCSAYIDASANVAEAHKLAKGAGIKIAIIDEGIDISHPEFSGGNKIIAPANFESKSFDNNPLPRDPDESHGTACAGVALASGRFGASGVAPDAALIPIRYSAPLGSFSEAQTFIWAVQHGADIISCSWGPTDGDPLDPADPYHFKTTPLYPLTRRAIDYAVKEGRQGKGCAIFFAAGNGNESVDNDGYASYKNVIAVAACNDKSRHSYYSDHGKAIFCSFPSSDTLSSLTRGIWTTDVTGPNGYNPGYVNYGDEYGNYLNYFGGTSSACPGAAGVAALVLSANPDLTLKELRQILKECCDKINPENGHYSRTGHSKWYGYGRLNAKKAVQLALERKNNQSEISESNISLTST